MKQKIVSWNVDGIRSCMRENNFNNYFENSNADIFCIQETKINKRNVDIDLKGYKQYWNFCQKKNGYSGTAIFSKKEPLNVTYGLKNEYDENVDLEGRVITLDYDNFYLVNVYVPNSQLNLKRKNFRLEFDSYFLNYIEEINNKKNVIICGDFNVAHKRIDSPRQFKKSKEINFSDEERAGFSNLLDIGLFDTYRYMHPQYTSYTWFFDKNDEKEDIGWRLDYILMSEELKSNLITSSVGISIVGSDHKPVEMELDI